jgi:putative sterol carrier protein
MIRQNLVDEIIRRFPDYIDADAAKGVDGIVGWELIGPGDEVDRFSLVVADGVVQVGRDLAAEPTVTLRLGAVSFLKIATGNGDPSTMVLSGDLEVVGDSWFALDLLRLVHIPTPDGTAHLDDPGKIDPGKTDPGKTDPVKIDPSAVARLVREIPDRQLPQYLDTERAAHVDALAAWQITGGRGGGVDEYRTLIRDGSCTVGELPGRPRASVRTDPVVFLKLLTGKASPLRTLLRRRLSLRGDVVLASRLPRIFHIPAG